jgi:flagellar basal body-associated protein FliL
MKAVMAEPEATVAQVRLVLAEAELPEMVALL